MAYQERKVGSENQGHTGGHIAGTNAHIANGRGIKFRRIYRHYGIARTYGELAHHQECDLQPEQVRLPLGDRRTAAGDAGTDQSGAEEPLLAHLGDDVHGHGDGGYFD